MDSDEDDEEPENEPGTSSNSQPIEPVLPHHQGQAENSQGPTILDNSADEDSEFRDEYSAQSQDSGRTVVYPDLYVLTNDEHWTMPPETHICSRIRIILLCDYRKLRSTVHMQLDHYAVCTTALYLNQVTNDFANIKVEVPKGVDGRTRDMLERCMATCGTRAKMRSRARKEASAQEVRGYYKHFAEAKHLESKSWVDNEVFDLSGLRKGEPRNYVTGRWLLTIKTDRQGNFLKEEARWLLRGFQDKQKEYQQTDSLASTRPGFRMSCQVAAGKGWNIFHIDLKTAFLQGQSCGAKRDVVCQLPPEAGHPPLVAARLKNPAYGMNDATRRWWNILDKALCSYGMVPTRSDLCCYVLYSMQSRERIWKENNCTLWNDTSNISNKPRVRTEIPSFTK